MASKLEELNLSQDEVERFSKAFKDETFRELFVQYAEEINDPENRRKYEEELSILENERGMDIQFIHPQPGHVLCTSIDGVQKCYLNICSNELIQKPQCTPGRDKGQRGGQHWALPYSLAPGREDLGKRGTKHMIYDVVFHPDTLYIASKNDKFKEMVDSTALEAVTKQFDVKLDQNNVKTLSIKYKGVPQTAVLRKPRPGATPQPEEPNDPLSFPYPYDAPGGANTQGGESSEEKPKKNKLPPVTKETDDGNQQHDKATVPHYTILHRSYVDLQDYRDARDSTPSPVPRELIITVDLPLLNSSLDVILDIKDKLLTLESESPTYKLQLNLPYPVDESEGKAQFNKSKKQLVITLPVVREKQQDLLPEASDESNNCELEADELVNEIPEENNINCEEEGSPCDSASSPSNTLPHDKEKQEETQEAGKDPTQISSKTPPAEGQFPELQETWNEHPQAASVSVIVSDAPVCPPFTITQDTTSLTLVIHVKDIEENTISSEVSTHRYQIRFSVKESNISYDLCLQFPLPDSVNTNGNSVSISRNNAVLRLTKSPERFGLWDNVYFGSSKEDLQERQFVIEDNIKDLFEDNLQPSLTLPPTLKDPLSIKVLEMTNNRTHIRLMKPDSDGGDFVVHKEQSNDLTEKNNGINREPDNGIVAHSETAKDDPQNSPDNKDKPVDKPEEILEGGEKPELILDTAKPTCEEQSSNAEADLIRDKKVDDLGVKDNAVSVKDNVKIIQEKQVDEQDRANDTKPTPGNISTRECPTQVLKEVVKEDGTEQVITDHTTHCAFTFQNTLLYDLD